MTTPPKSPRPRARLLAAASASGVFVLASGCSAIVGLSKQTFDQEDSPADAADDATMAVGPDGAMLGTDAMPGTDAMTTGTDAAASEDATLPLDAADADSSASSCSGSGWHLDCTFGQSGFLTLPAVDAGTDAGASAPTLPLLVEATATVGVFVGMSTAAGDPAIWTVSSDASVALDTVATGAGTLADLGLAADGNPVVLTIASSGGSGTTARVTVLDTPPSHLDLVPAMIGFASPSFRPVKLLGRDGDAYALGFGSSAATQTNAGIGVADFGAGTTSYSLYDSVAFPDIYTASTAARGDVGTVLLGTVQHVVVPPTAPAPHLTFVPGDGGDAVGSAISSLGSISAVAVVDAGSLLFGSSPAGARALGILPLNGATQGDAGAVTFAHALATTHLDVTPMDGAFLAAVLGTETDESTYLSLGLFTADGSPVTSFGDGGFFYVPVGFGATLGGMALADHGLYVGLLNVVNGQTVPQIVRFVAP